jgi:hypothetical protein
MTRATQMAIVSSLLAQERHVKAAGHEKEAVTLLARGMGHLLRFGGKAIGGAARRAARSGRRFPVQGGRTLQVPPSRFDRALQRTGRNLQHGASRVASKFDDWARNHNWAGGLSARGKALRGASQPPTIGPLPLPPSTPPPVGGRPYGWGTRWANEPLDSWAAKGGWRRPVRNVVGLAVPHTLHNPVLLGSTIGLGMDRHNHAKRVEQAGHFGAAEALAQLRQNPFTQGIPAMMVGTERMTKGLTDKKLPGVAHHLRQLEGPDGDAYRKGFLRRSMFGAMLPGVNTDQYDYRNYY